MVIALTPPADSPWLRPAEYWPSLQATTAELDPPFGVISLPALAHNAFDMLRRAGGITIRVASKSVRVRGVIDAVLALPGYSGVLAFTLAEALWLAEGDDVHEGISDVVVGYPSVDRAAIRRLALDPLLASRVTLMIDSIDQLDYIDAVVAPADREQIRVCLELDASWNPAVLGHLGTFRSPVFTVLDVRALAERIVARPGFTLVGMMAYEGQIAGLGNEPQSAVRGSPCAGSRGNRPANLPGAAPRRWPPCARSPTSSLSTVAAPARSNLRAQSLLSPRWRQAVAYSGLTSSTTIGIFFLPRLPRSYCRWCASRRRGWRPFSEGWVASGPPAADRLPLVAWPEGTTMVGNEMAGEVQTPLTGETAARLAVGDRVWLRHTKAGELSEHLDGFTLVDDSRIVGTLPTYRGEGKAFL